MNDGIAAACGLAFLLGLLYVAGVALAQDGPVSGSSVGGVRAGGAGSIRQGSRPIGEGSRSMRSSSVGSMHSPPVRPSSRGSMLSGPLSDVSSGPTVSGVPMSGGGAVEQSSVGAVKKDINSPLGERISETLTDMQALQESLRAVRPVPRFTPLPGQRAAQEEQLREQMQDMEDRAAGEEPPPAGAEPEEPAMGSAAGEPESEPEAAVDQGMPPADAVPPEKTGSEIEQGEPEENVAPTPPAAP